MFRRLKKIIADAVRVPNAKDLAMRELEDARRALLDAQSSREYAESMVKYHESRIRRLSTYLTDY